MKRVESHFHIKTDPECIDKTELLIDTIHKILLCTEWHDIKKIQLTNEGLIIITTDSVIKDD